MDFKPIITISLEEYLEKINYSFKSENENSDELIVIKCEEKKKRKITPPLLLLK